MKTGLLPVIVFSLGLGAAATAQDANTTPPASQPQASQGNGNGGGNRGGGYGQRGGYGGAMGGGRGIMGTVTEVAADHYMVKTETGDIYTVHFSANTRIMKMPAGAGGGMGGGQGRGGGQGQGAGMNAGGGGGMGAGGGMGGGMGRGGNPPQPIKPTDIKVGDAVGAMGEIDSTAKTVGAVAVVQLDPERAKQMLDMQANYGKTWIMGKVTAIDGVKVTLMGTVDNASHAFVADENTTFRKRRDPITLADIQVGDVVRAEGALKDGTFTATTVNVAGMPQGGTPSVPRNAPPSPPQ